MESELLQDSSKQFLISLIFFGSKSLNVTKPLSRFHFPIFEVSLFCYPELKSFKDGKFMNFKTFEKTRSGWMSLFFAHTFGDQATCLDSPRLVFWLFWSLFWARSEMHKSHKFCTGLSAERFGWNCRRTLRPLAPEHSRRGYTLRIHAVRADVQVQFVQMKLHKKFDRKTFLKK